MGLLTIAWIGGLIAYFSLTTERKRESNLLTLWVLLGGAALLPLIALLL